MKPFRIIPRLDMKGPNLVKGIHLEGLRVLGKPEDFAFQYYLEGADELLYMDVVASLYGRNSLLDIIRRTAQKIFIPLTVGGGIRTIDDIRAALFAGADKVAINTAAVRNPSFITEAAHVFGSQCIVVSIEAKQKGENQYEAYTDNGREKTGLDVFEWAVKAYELGAGELLVTSIDREGTGKGCDVGLIKKISDSVPIPVIACGGVGNKEDVASVMRDTKIDGIAAASVFHYKRLRDIISEELYEGEGNIEFLKRHAEQSTKRFDVFAIDTLKTHLINEGLSVRPSCIGIRTKEPMKKRTATDPKVTIVDYGLGNLFSVARVLTSLGAAVEITSDPTIIEKAGRLILPGVGSFGDGMANIRKRGLIEPLLMYAATGKPLLGICLGMQLLMSTGEEFGIHKGLDIIRGTVKRMDIGNVEQLFYKIPHVGWNRIFSISNAGWEDAILSSIDEGALVYFVHSNVVMPEDKRESFTETEYGGARFCSAVKKGAIYGFQFHPEMSGETGLAIYNNFIYGGNKNAKKYDRY